MINTYIPTDLIKKHLRGEKLTAVEQKILDLWLSEDPYHRVYLEEISQPGRIEEVKEVTLQMDHEAIRRKFKARKRRGEVVTMYKRIAVAIAVLVCVGCIYLVVRMSTPSNITVEQTAWYAATTRPRLILPDGKVMDPDSIDNGVLSNVAGRNIIKTDKPEQQLALSEVSDGKGAIYTGDISLTMPAQRSYKMLLPDGSKVWLNPGSSIRISLDYAKKERRVEMRGDAYFEVEKKTVQPFRVAIEDGEITVLGTSFYVRAYPDEHRVWTKVSSGAVKVDLSGDTLHLAEGEALRYDKNSAQPFFKYEISSDSIGVWRKWHLDFTHQDPRGIAEIVSKWYGLETPQFLQGADTMKVQLYNGSLDGRIPLRNILRQLSRPELEFRVEGNHIQVVKK